MPVTITRNATRIKAAFHELVRTNKLHKLDDGGGGFPPIKKPRTGGGGGGHIPRFAILAIGLLMGSIISSAILTAPIIVPLLVLAAFITWVGLGLMRRWT